MTQLDLRIVNLADINPQNLLDKVGTIKRQLDKLGSLKRSIHKSQFDKI